MPTTSSNIDIQNTLTDALRLDDGSSNYVEIVAPSIGTNYTLTLPTDDGDSGEVLTTDGSGNLSWAAASGGGSIEVGSITNGQTTTSPSSDDVFDALALKQNTLTTSTDVDLQNIMGDTLRVDDGSSNYVEFVAPSIGTNYTLTLPTDDGNAANSNHRWLWCTFMD